MELYIFKPTGETRCPKTNEWFGDMDGQFVLARSNFTYPNPIYERIAIEVPEGAELMTYSFRKDRGFAGDCILLAKPKVKKWLWERPHSAYGGLVIRTAKPMTESEVNALDITSHGWRKVEGSEVEMMKYSEKSLV